MEMVGHFFNGGLLPNSSESRLKIFVSERTSDPSSTCLQGATPTKSLPGACGVFLTSPNFTQTSLSQWIKYKCKISNTNHIEMDIYARQEASLPELALGHAVDC
jgi:hypothetical protein